MSSQKIRRQGLSLNEKMNTSSEENVLKGNTIKQKLFTPCRRIGLNKKRKALNTSPIVDINLTNNETEKSNISEVQNYNKSVSELIKEDSPKTIMPKKKVAPQKKRKIDNNINDDKISLNISPEIGKKLKLSQSKTTKKVSTIPVSINISRCNLDSLNLKAGVSEDKQNKKIENDQNISSNKEVSSANETNLETVNNEAIKEVPETTTNKILPGNNSLDDSDGSDFYPNVTRRKKKKILTNKQRSTPKPGPSKQKENIEKIKKKVANNLNYDSDSDDDFISKPRRDRTNSSKGENNVTKEGKNKFKKIITPPVDDFNKTDHIRIAENKSYTIIHKDNVVSYVKCYDNDVNFKVTESDDNQQEPTRDPVIYPQKSMILERKNYLPKNKNVSSDETVLLEMPSIFEDIISSLEKQDKIEINEAPKEKNEEKDVSIKQLKDELVTLQNKVKLKQERVERLKRISVYKESHNLEELQELTLKFKRGSQEALIDLLLLLKQHSETPFGMPTLLSYLKVPNKLIGYNEEEDKFM